MPASASSSFPSSLKRTKQMLNERMQRYLELIEPALEQSLPQEDGSEVCSAMRYSLCAGGKRIRPVLLLESHRLCGGDVKNVLPFACALEMIHTYSLIHDDLPCMDDDDLRRGRPSCHKQFGEATALLAGDALLTHAFLLCMQNDFAEQRPDLALRAVGLLAANAGIFGMIGGQEIDLAGEGKRIPLETLQTMDEKKTGALIKAACKIGAALAESRNAQYVSLQRYAEHLGQAFQIVDDILDVEGDTETLGKPVGSDAESSKSTYVSLLGLERAKQLAAALTEKAVNALTIFGEDAAFLRDLAEQLCKRTY